MTRERAERLGGLSARVFSPGQGTPKGAVVLVHGICLSGVVWKRWAEHFAQRGVEAWCLDLRGHGDSDGRDEVGSARMEDYAADVEAALITSGAQAIVGHDMGGLVAQMVATRIELRGLALVGSVAPKGLAGPSSLLLFWRELRPRYVRAILRGKSWQPTEADLTSLACGKLTEEDRAELLSWVAPESGVAAREISISGVPIDSAKIRCPVLVVATTLDILTPPARQRLISSHLRADYVEFAQHAHFPMLEPGWERPAAVVARWLEEAARIGDSSRGSVARMAARRGTPTPSPSPVLASSLPEKSTSSEEGARATSPSVPPAGE